MKNKPIAKIGNNFTLSALFFLYTMPGQTSLFRYAPGPCPDKIAGAICLPGLAEEIIKGFQIAAEVL